MKDSSTIHGPTRLDTASSVSEQYYREFEGKIFFIQMPGGLFLQDDPQARKILETIRMFRDHGIHVTIMFTGGPYTQHVVESATKHRSLTPMLRKNVISGIQEEVVVTARLISSLCEEIGLGCEDIGPHIVEAERKLGCGETGRVMAVDSRPIVEAIERKNIPIVPFGGMESGEYLYVNPDDNAAEVAHEVSAHKLLFLSDTGAIRLPNKNGNGSSNGKTKVCYIDHDRAMHLFREQGVDGTFIIQNDMASKLVAGARAVSGNVSQVHYLPPEAEALRDDVLTHTGGDRGGTLLEYRHSHRITTASMGDLDAIMRLREESSKEEHHKTPGGTPYLKPMPAKEMAMLIQNNVVFVFKHRNIAVGSMYHKPIDGHVQVTEIGGFVIGENYQSSQYGKELFEHVWSRIHEAGIPRAISLTASEKLSPLYKHYGMRDSGEFADFTRKSLGRYGADAHLLETWVFDTSKPL